MQVDTLSLSFPGGKGVKQFTAVDRLSRLTVAVAARRAAGSAARSLGTRVAELPFALNAIQIDGGSAFMAEFEAACEARGIALHVLPPRSSELNGRVERLQATSCYALSAVYDPPCRIDRRNPLINAFAHRYNTYRPHDAFGKITPRRVSSRCKRRTSRRLECAEPGQGLAMPARRRYGATERRRSSAG